MPCPRCPHCLAQGAFGVLDADDPALTTNVPVPTKAQMVAARQAHKLRRGAEFAWCSCGKAKYYGKPTHDRASHGRHVAEAALIL